MTAEGEALAIAKGESLNIRFGALSGHEPDEAISRKGGYGISVGISGSLRLDAGRPDHLAPLLDLFGDACPPSRSVITGPPPR